MVKSLSSPHPGIHHKCRKCCRFRATHYSNISLGVVIKYLSLLLSSQLHGVMVCPWCIRPHSNRHVAGPRFLPSTDSSHEYAGVKDDAACQRSSTFVAVVICVSTDDTMNIEEQLSTTVFSFITLRYLDERLFSSTKCL